MRVFVLYTVSMFSEKTFSALAVLAVIAVTVGYFVTIEPEDMHVFSQDKLVHVTGVARQSQPLRIETQTQVALPRAGLAYRLVPDEVILDQAVQIDFDISGYSDLALGQLQPYRYHSDLRMWEVVEGVNFSTDHIIFETTQLGTFVLAALPDVVAPVFADVYADMRAQAPVHAVGYETAVGYVLPDQEAVRLIDVGEQGGCGGTVRVGDAEELSRLERDLLVHVQDELRPVKFVFVTRWFTSSTGGCGAEASLAPLSEYDILGEIHL
jgi:hypothetical protein